MHILGRLLGVVFLIYIHPLWRIYYGHIIDEKNLDLKIEKKYSRRKLLTKRLELTS